MYIYIYIEICIHICIMDRLLLLRRVAPRRFQRTPSFRQTWPRYLSTANILPSTIISNKYQPIIISINTSTKPKILNPKP